MTHLSDFRKEAAVYRDILAKHDIQSTHMERVVAVDDELERLYKALYPLAYEGGDNKLVIGRDFHDNGEPTFHVTEVKDD